MARVGLLLQWFGCLSFTSLSGMHLFHPFHPGWPQGHRSSYLGLTRTVSVRQYIPITTLVFSIDQIIHRGLTILVRSTRTPMLSMTLPLMKVGHCINHIRQSLQCHADLTPMEWKLDGLKLILKTDTPHTCRNFDRIHAWATSHRTRFESIQSWRNASIRIVD